MLLRTILLVVFSAAAAFSQNLSAQELTTERIKNLIRSEQPLDSMTIPLLARMGDGAAAEIQKAVAAMGTLNARQQANIVVMIHKAFENVGAITQPANRTPQRSEALLDQIASGTQDFSLRLKIADTRQFVESARR